MPRRIRHQAKLNPAPSLGLGQLFQIKTQKAVGSLLGNEGTLIHAALVAA